MPPELMQNHAFFCFKQRVVVVVALVVTAHPSTISGSVTSPHRAPPERSGMEVTTEDDSGVKNIRFWSPIKGHRRH